MLSATIKTNAGAVTWIGDLGSVLAEWKFKAINKDEALTEAEAQAIMNEFASPADMLGNIDAYAMSKTATIGATSGGRKVSEILRSYYFGEASTPAGDVREHRYSTFAASVGLEGWNGTAFSNEDAWVEQYGGEVSSAAALYIGATTEGIAKYPGALGMSMNPGGKALARLYLEALKKRILTEPITTPKLKD